jgi:excisionase family DNA binding protein
MDVLPSSEKLAYRINEAVNASGLGRSFLYEAIKSKALPAFKAGGRRLILRSDLVAYLERQKQNSVLTQG